MAVRYPETLSIQFKAASPPVWAKIVAAEIAGDCDSRGTA